MAEEKEKVDIFDEVETVDDSKKSKKESKKENKEINRLESELKVLKEENEKLFKEKDELNNKYLMSLAESKNYKKRCDDEMDRFYKYSSFDICKQLVGILDSFDLALDKKQEDEKMIAFLDGFKLTRNQIFKILEKEGVKEIDAENKEFDPNYMVALRKVEDKTKKDQEVVQVFMKGYMFKDRVLRPANVVVNVINNSDNNNEKENE